MAWCGITEQWKVWELEGAKFIIARLSCWGQTDDFVAEPLIFSSAGQALGGS